MQGLLVGLDGISGEKGNDAYRWFVLVAKLHKRLWMGFSVAANKLHVSPQLHLLKADLVSHLYQSARIGSRGPGVPERRASGAPG